MARVWRATTARHARRRIGMRACRLHLAQHSFSDWRERREALLRWAPGNRWLHDITRADAEVSITSIFTIRASMGAGYYFLASGT